MKTLVVLLVLVNVALLGWQYNNRVRAQAQAIVERPEIPAGTPSLVLVRELDTLPELTATAEPAQVPDAVESDVKTDVVAANVCLDVGPFPDAAARDALGTWMQDFVAASHTRSETVRSRQFFWVYLEPTSSADAAKQNLASLAERGVQDTMLISRGDLKNAISLGLFRSQDSVNRRLAELSEKGYKPVVVPRFEESQAYFVALQLAESASGRPDIPASLLGDAKVTDIPCSDLPDTPPVAEAAPESPAAEPEPIVEGLTD